MTLSAGARWLLDGAARWSLAASGGASLPTGDEDEGLSKGESNVFASLALSYDAGPGAAALSLGRQITGDREDEPLADTWRLGVSYALTSEDSSYLGAALDARQAPLPDIDDGVELTLFAGRALGASALLGGYVTAGAGDAAPELALGVSLTLSPRKAPRPPR